MDKSWVWWSGTVSIFFTLTLLFKLLNSKWVFSSKIFCHQGKTLFLFCWAVLTLLEGSLADGTKLLLFPPSLSSLPAIIWWSDIRPISGIWFFDNDSLFHTTNTDVFCCYLNNNNNTSNLLKRFFSSQRRLQCNVILMLYCSTHAISMWSWQ